MKIFLWQGNHYPNMTLLKMFVQLPRKIFSLWWHHTLWTLVFKPRYNQYFLRSLVISSELNLVSSNLNLGKTKQPSDT